MPLGRINGGLQGELPFAPTIRYSLPFAQSPVAIRHSLPLLSWLFRANRRSPRLYGRHKGLPLPFAIRHSLPFDQSPVAIR
jgi:hypothetical protein